MLTGILKVLRLPPQCTFWRFLASLRRSRWIPTRPCTHCSATKWAGARAMDDKLQSLPVGDAGLQPARTNSSADSLPPVCTNANWTGALARSRRRQK